MHRRFLAVLAGAAMLWSLGMSPFGSGPAKADPAVTGVAIGAVASLLWGIYENPDQPDADREFVFGGAGIFDVVDDENQAILFNAEYWAPVTFYRFRPIAGVIGTSDEAIGGYVGIRHDVNFGKNFVVSTNISALGIDAGDGKWLGASVVLRTGVELGYRMDNGIRLSAGFHHMSHGELFSDTNPGTETATFSVAVPTDVLFGGQAFKGKHYAPKLFGW